MLHRLGLKFFSERLVLGPLLRQIQSSVKQAAEALYNQ